MQNEFKLSEYKTLIDAVLESDGEFRIYPKGNSMRPLLREGACAVTLIRPKDELKVMDIILYQRDSGQYVLHRIMKRMENEAGKTYVLCGDHQTVWEPGITSSQVIGLVKGIYRKEKEINTKSFGYRFYLLLWCRCFFIRKAVLKIICFMKRRKKKEEDI